MPHLIRWQVAELDRRGEAPDVLVNLTNDGWFWGSSILDMQLNCAVFRAVEMRRPFLVAANTGFSAWIDGNGTVLAKGPRRATGTLLAEVVPDGRTSWYEKWGDVPLSICVLFCLVMALQAVARRAMALAHVGRIGSDGQHRRPEQGRRRAVFGCRSAPTDVAQSPRSPIFRVLSETSARTLAPAPAALLAARRRVHEAHGSWQGQPAARFRLRQR